MLPNSTGVTLPAFALTWKPVPEVERTTPRGEFTLKKFAGRLFGAANVSGTPSQLISRRPSPKLPATFGFKAPRSLRKRVTAGRILPVVVQEAERTSCASVREGSARIRSARAA